MNNTEKKYSTQIAQIMRAARKYRGLTQADIAKGLGITQGTLSKLEQGSLVISTPLWFEFCEQTRISPRSFLEGYIDFTEPQLEKPEDESSFRLPKRYGFSRGSTVRGIRGLVEFARTHWGEKKLNDFLDRAGIDPDFFRVLPNQINIQFSYDLLKELRDAGLLTKENMRKMAQAYASPEFHGSLRHFFNNQLPIKDLLKLFIRGQYLYQENFEYTLDLDSSDNQTEVYIEGKPAAFMSAFETGAEIGRSFCDFKTFFLESVLKASHSKTHKVRHTQCLFNGHSSCQFSIQL